MRDSRQTPTQKTVVPTPEEMKCACFVSSCPVSIPNDASPARMFCFLPTVVLENSHGADAYLRLLRLFGIELESSY